MKQWVGNRSDANVKTKNLGNANLLSSLLNTDKALPKHQLAAQPNSRALQLRYYYYFFFYRKFDCRDFPERVNRTEIQH